MIDKQELVENQKSFESLKRKSPEEILNPKLKEEWGKFLRIFSEEKIKDLQIENYVLDKNNPEGSFCYWVEVRLDKLGNMHGSFALKFGLYLSKETREYIFTKKFGATKEEAFNKIKQSLVDLLSAGKIGDLDKIKENLLSRMFKGKILFLYYSNKFINVLSDNHLDYFLREFEIPYHKELDTVDKRIKLIEFKNRDPIMKNWTIQEFSSFLYKFYRPPKKPLQQNDDEQEQNEIIKKVGRISKEQIITELEKVEPISEDEIEIRGKSYKRDNRTIAFLKILRNFKCQLCETSILKKDGSFYVEASHITAKHKKGSELPTNILILCPNHHKEFDYAKREIIKRTNEEIIFKLNDREYKVNLKLE